MLERSHRARGAGERDVDIPFEFGVERAEGERAYRRIDERFETCDGSVDDLARFRTFDRW